MNKRPMDEELFEQLLDEELELYDEEYLDKLISEKTHIPEPKVERPKDQAEEEEMQQSQDLAQTDELDADQFDELDPEEFGKKGIKAQGFIDQINKVKGLHNKPPMGEEEATEAKQKIKGRMMDVKKQSEIKREIGAGGPPIDPSEMTESIKDLDDSGNYIYSEFLSGKFTGVTEGEKSKIKTLYDDKEIESLPKKAADRILKHISAKEIDKQGLPTKC